MPDSFDDLQRQFEKMRLHSDKAAAIRKQVDGSGASVAIPSVGIKVSVGAGGRVMDIELSREALRVSPSSLSSAILRCARAAAVSYAKKLDAALNDAFGEEEFGLELRQELYKQYPELRKNEE